MPAKFVIKQGSTGKYRFNLHAANGQIVATSESYETKRAALNGIKSVQTNAAKAPIEDTTVAPKKAAVRSATKKKAPAKKSRAKKATKKKATKKKATAKKATAKKSPAKKATSRRAARRARRS